MAYFGVAYSATLQNLIFETTLPPPPAHRTCMLITSWLLTCFPRKDVRLTTGNLQSGISESGPEPNAWKERKETQYCYHSLSFIHGMFYPIYKQMLNNKNSVRRGKMFQDGHRHRIFSSSSNQRKPHYRIISPRCPVYLWEELLGSDCASPKVCRLLVYCMETLQSMWSR